MAEGTHEKEQLSYAYIDHYIILQYTLNTILYYSILSTLYY